MTHLLDVVFKRGQAHQKPGDDPSGDLESRLGHRFRNRALLDEALTHSSLANELKAEQNIERAHNERLEFLGDAVLQLVVTEQIFERLPRMEPGDLSKVRASLVNADHLAILGKRIGLTRALRIGRSLRKDPRRFERPGLLADCFEAVLGAVYQDAGFEEARRVILTHFSAALDKVVARKGPLTDDYKSALQERTMADYQVLPEYQLLAEDESSDEERFTMRVSLNGEALAEGRGRSKKAAAQEAARKALDVLEARSAHEER